MSTSNTTQSTPPFTPPINASPASIPLPNSRPTSSSSMSNSETSSSGRDRESPPNQKPPSSETSNDSNAATNNDTNGSVGDKPAGGDGEEDEKRDEDKSVRPSRPPTPPSSFGSAHADENPTGCPFRLWKFLIWLIKIAWIQLLGCISLFTIGFSIWIIYIYLFHHQHPHIYTQNAINNTLTPSIDQIIGNHTNLIASAKRRYNVYECAKLPSINRCNEFYHVFIARDSVACRAGISRLKDICWKVERDMNLKLEFDWEEVVFDGFVRRPVGGWIRWGVEGVMGRGLDGWGGVEWLNDKLDAIPRVRLEGEF